MMPLVDWDRLKAYRKARNRMTIVEVVPARKERKKYKRSRLKTPEGLAAHRKAAYGLNAEDIQHMRISQGDQCAICWRKFSDDRSFQVDHCHATGRVRGLLCGNCNRALGAVKDSIESLERAIAYLRRSRGQTEGA